MTEQLDIDPDAILDYAFDWKTKTHHPTDPKATDWLATNETIDTVEIIPSDGITIDSHTEDDGLVTVWVSGATPIGSSQSITCRITTDQGRTDDRTRPLYVTDR